MDKTSPREVLLKHGRWVSATEFAKLVAEKKNVSERQAKTLISKALISKANLDHAIMRHVFSDRTVIYGLAEFGPPTGEATHRSIGEPDVERVRKALEELRFEFCFFKEPTVKEVARRAGLPPELVESVLYEHAPETGWGEPPENPRKEAENAINLAGWLCWKQKGVKDSIAEGLAAEAINNASPDVRKKAELIVKSFPDLVPVVGRRILEWPLETQRRWRQLFGSTPPGPPNWGVGAIMGDSDETLNSLSRRRF